MSNYLTDEANPIPVNRKMRPHTRADGNGVEHTFEAETVFVYEKQDRRKFAYHRAVFFLTEANTLIVHYTEICTSFNDFAANRVFTVDFTKLRTAFYARGWRRLFAGFSVRMASITSQVNDRIADDITNVVMSLLQPESSPFRVHIT